jgi:hypothetical protein
MLPILKEQHIPIMHGHDKIPQLSPKVRLGINILPSISIFPSIIIDHIIPPHLKTTIINNLRIQYFHFGDTDFLLLLYVLVFQLGDFNNVSVFGACVDRKHFVRVEEVHTDGDFVLEVKFARGGEVLVDLCEEV